MTAKYRCETCNKPKLGQCPVNGKLFPDDFSGFMIGLKSVGCASHSDFEPNEHAIQNAITFACENHDRELRKDEREKVLDELFKWIPTVTYDQEHYEPAIDAYELKKKIESLRQEGKVESNL